MVFFYQKTFLGINWIRIKTGLEGRKGKINFTASGWRIASQTSLIRITVFGERIQAAWPWLGCGCPPPKSWALKLGLGSNQPPQWMVVEFVRLWGGKRKREKQVIESPGLASPEQ